jgi:hypothetical protein
LAGAGIEHLRLSWTGLGKSEPEIKETVRVAETPARIVTVRDEAAERAAEALRKRVAELEKALAERSAGRVRQSEQPQTEEAREEQRDERGGRQSWEERMERMRTEDPERYAEMQRRREEFRQSMEQRARDRADFLDAIDVAGMAPEQRANHEKLLETVARVNELTAQMMQSGRRRGEEGDTLRQEMGETMATLGQLYDAERQYLFEATAKAAGYTGSDVQAFTEHIQTIIENTSMMPGFGRRGGGPPPNGR